MNTILLVDDNKNQLILYEQELSLEGYEIVMASDGKEALEKVEEESPDLIIMDINMPNMNGLEAMGRIISKQKGIPTIIHTAYSNYKTKFMSWAAEAYIVKSSDLTELKTKIKELLANKADELMAIT